MNGMRLTGDAVDVLLDVVLDQPAHDAGLVLVRRSTDSISRVCTCGTFRIGMLKSCRRGRGG
jgi:hypothetical protein